jgi:hypothetical protein
MGKCIEGSAMFSVVSPLGEIRRPRLRKPLPRRSRPDGGRPLVGLLENGGGGISLRTSSIQQLLENMYGADVVVQQKKNRSHEAGDTMLAAFSSCWAVICAVAE